MKNKDKELFVRKKLVALIEKVLRFYGDDIEHDTFKAILYGEIGARTKTEEAIKAYYDAYLYLLGNRKSAVTSKLLSKFFFVFNGSTIEEVILVKITSFFFKTLDDPLIERLVSVPRYAYLEMTFLKDLERIMVALMIFNFILAGSDIPTVPFLYPQLSEYLSLLKDEDSSKLAEFVKNLLETAVFQEKSYYKNLKPLDTFDVQKAILADQELLTQKCGIKHVYVYGSFAKGIERIDSDIDLLFEFSGDLTYSEKQEVVNRLTDHYFKVFNRYVDIYETGPCVNDHLIIEVRKYKKIF